MRLFKLVVAYDGSSFVGWQRQASGASIQGVIESVLTQVTGAAVTVVGAGRTDAGVHALGQVASVRVGGALEVDQLWRALNGLLPPDIRIVDLAVASHDFHARYGARAKRYEYRLVTGAVMLPFEWRYAWHVTHALDVPAMERALEAVVGTHDFASCQATGSRVRDTVRTIFDASIAHDAGDRGLTVMLRGDGFLRHMVRTIVGTLVEIGRGRWPPEYMGELIASRDRRRAGPTAPPQGLFLVEVEY